MGYALLWIESLVASLLLVALATAVAARLRSRGRGPRRFGWTAMAVSSLPLIGGVLLTVFAFELRTRNVTPDWLTYCLSWTLLGLAISPWLARHARLKGDTPVAASWPLVGLGAWTVAAWAALLITFSAMIADVDRQMAALAAGQSAVALSLTPGPVPDADNAALGYREAVALLDAAPGKPWYQLHANAPTSGDKISPEQAARWLEALQPALRQFRKAAALSRYYFETNLLNSYAPGLSDIRRLANFAVWDARESARRGDFKTTVADLAAIWRFAEHLNTGPLLLTYVTALAVQSTGTDELEDILAATPPRRPEDLTALQAVMPRSLEAGLGRALRHEEALFLLRLSASSYEPAEPFVVGEENIYRLPIVGDLAKVYLLPEDTRSYMYWIEMVQYVYDHQSAHEWAKLFPGDIERAPKGLRTSTQLPNLLRLGQYSAGTETRARLARAAVAATAYQLKNKRHPAALEELVPEFLDAVPIDPYTGGPIKLLAADGGLVLYGVGSDLKDDKGAERKRGAPYGEGDITFCLGAAYAARRNPAAPAPAPKK
jgi:hypothetical protein